MNLPSQYRDGHEIRINKGEQFGALSLLPPLISDHDGRYFYGGRRGGDMEGLAASAKGAGLRH